MSEPFVYEMLFKGNAASAKAAIAEVQAATGSLTNGTQAATSAVTAETAATLKNAEAKRAAAAAAKEAAAAEAIARMAYEQSQTGVGARAPQVPGIMPAPQLQAATGHVGAANAYTAQLTSQWSDIAMMAAAGQNPMMLMMQQGSQVTEAFQRMRMAGIGVGAALRTSFLGMLNPMSLATMAVIGFGTAAVQWLMNSREEAKSLDDALGDLEKSSRAAASALKDARSGTADLASDFGSGAKTAREMNVAILALTRAQSVNDLKVAIDSIGDAIGDVSSMGVVRLRKLEDQFNLTNKGAVRVKDAMDMFRHATTQEAQELAAKRLAEALAEAEYNTEGASKEATSFGENVARVVLEAVRLRGTTEQQLALEKALEKAGIDVPFETAAEKAKTLKDLTSDVMAALKSTRAPFDLRDDLEKARKIGEATVKYGADSLEVKRLQIEADRQQFQLQLRFLDTTEEHKKQLLELWDVTKGLKSADPFGSLAAGREYLRTQQDSIAKSQLELGLIGQSEAARRRILALYEAELQIRDMHLDRNGEEAVKIRQAAVAAAEAEANTKRVRDAWDEVQSAGEGAIDGIFAALKTGDVAGAFDSLASEIGSMFEQLAITNPLKNAIFGSDYATMGDVGGLSGIWDRLTGKAGPLEIAGISSKSVGAMTVTAAQVIINGSLSVGTSANLNGAPMSLQGSTDVQSQVWNFFARKGLAPHQIAAIMGNVAGESGFNPLAIGDNGTSFGLFQHHAARADGLLASLGGVGGLGNVQGQLDYAWKELLSSHSGALAALKAAPDVGSATDAWMRQFERPSNEAMTASFPQRMAAAEAAMAKFSATTTTASGNLGTLGNGFDVFGNALAQGLNGMASGGGQGGLMGFFGTLATGIAGSLGIPGFAGGGYHAGGLRIVGENGPELEYTGPSTIVPADMTRRIMAGGTPANASVAPVIQLQPTLVNTTSVPMKMEVQEVADSRGQRQQKYVLSEAVASGLSAQGGATRRSLRDIYGLRPAGILR